MIKFFLILLAILFELFFVSSAVHAGYSVHPVQLYEIGEKILSSYQGNPSTLNDAKKIFQRLIDKYPSSSLGYLGMCHVVVIESYRYGHHHYDMSKIHDEALPLVIKALELGPTLEIVHRQYAVIEDISAAYLSHQKEIEAQLLRKPDSPETYFHVANLMMDQGEIQKAVKYFHVVLDMKPDKSLQLKVFKRLGWIALFKYHRPESAIEQYQRGLEIWKDCPVMNGYLGIAYFHLGRYDLSVEYLNHSIMVLPNHLMRQYFLHAQGRLYRQRGLPEQAIEQFEKALQYGDNLSLHWLLGNMYFEQNDFLAAFHHFQRVIDSEPDKPVAYYFAARALFFLGKPSRAVDYYATYLKHNPDFENSGFPLKSIPD